MNPRPKSSAIKKKRTSFGTKKTLEDAHDIHEEKLALKEIKEKGSLSFEEMKKRMS